MNFFFLCILLGRCHFNIHIQQLMYVSNSNFFFIFHLLGKTSIFFWLHIVLLLTNEQIYSKKNTLLLGRTIKREIVAKEVQLNVFCINYFPSQQKHTKLNVICSILYPNVYDVNTFLFWMNESFFFLFFVIIALIRFYFILTCHITRIHLRKDEITLHTNI